MARGIVPQQGCRLRAFVNYHWLRSLLKVLGGIVRCVGIAEEAIIY